MKSINNAVEPDDSIGAIEFFQIKMKKKPN